jgi:hypothetical protein
MTGPMIDMSNTFGITSAFVLRSLITQKTAWQAFDSVDLPGYRFEKGQSVSLFFPGLNRDPKQWKNPHQQDFGRVRP